MQFPPVIHDRQAEYFTRFEERLARRLAATITPALIEEHRRKPLGQHSDALERVLNYFRRGGMAGKVAIFQPDPGRPGYRLVRLPGMRGGTATPVPGETIPSLDAAHHAAFLQRITDLTDRLAASPEGATA